MSKSPQFTTLEAVRAASDAGIAIPLADIVRLYRAQNDELEFSLRMWRVSQEKRVTNR